MQGGIVMSESASIWFNPIELSDAIGCIFSHNEILPLFRQDPSTSNMSVEIWRGMAHELPQEYLTCKDWRIFGSLCETLDDSDVINIELAD